MKFAYWTDRSGIPQQTTLCAFFWRAFVLVPLFTLAIIAFVVAFVVALVVLLVSNWKTTLWTIAGVGMAGGIGVVVYYITEWSRKRRHRLGESEAPPSVFIAGVKAIKSKFCPIIEIS